MSAATPATGAALRRRVFRLWLALCAPAVAVGAAACLLLLDLEVSEWRWLGGLGLACAGALAPAMRVALGRALAPVCAHVPYPGEPRASGAERPPDPALPRAAFAAVMDLPRVVAWLGGAGWLAVTAVVAAGMGLRFSSWGSFESAVAVLTGAALGFASAAFLPFLVKRAAAPVRDRIALEIPDPDERRALIRPTSLARKLTVSAVGMTVVPVVFAVLFVHAQTARSFEDLAIQWQHEVLARSESDTGRSAPGEPDEHIRVWTLDLAAPNPAALDASLLARLRADVQAGVRRGSAKARDGSYVIAWRHIGGDRLRVATTAVQRIRPDLWRSWTAIGVLLLVSSAIAAGLAHLLSHDLGRSARALRAEVDRLASGDLRTGPLHESEDEFGDLTRSFGAMAASLRATVAGVAEAAGRVEATAAELATVSESVGTVTAAQVRGIQKAAASMEAINGQVQGISGSTGELSRAVEESTGSILELGAAGEALNETAGVLSGQVDEVSSSIEQMVRSVRQVAASVEALAEASVDTSTSMEEMATSMRQVDGAAEETARLFEQVVDRAESGQEKVRQTIAGMEEIREATETADRVIRNLGSRTNEIGAIVDVIDDVADETNLLALNAAIIAAQAGEHGRAFTVVADQIKDLADRVLASTKEIGGLIRAVQSEGSNAIGAIERGTRSVASGVDLSAEAGVSLEQITRASRESGARIEAIVSAVREQAKAADHVVALMERVRCGVEEIRSAAAEQDRGNDVIYRGSIAMQQVAERVRGTTEEQARGAISIRESSEGVRGAVERIHGVLEQQTAATAAAAQILEAVSARTRDNEESAQRLDGATRGLMKQAEALRQQVRRFEI